MEFNYLTPVCGYREQLNQIVFYVIFIFTCWMKFLLKLPHYSDILIGAMASQFTSLTIVYSIVYSGADQRKHQSSASLAFVWGIHRRPVNSPNKGPVTRKMFPVDDVIMLLGIRFTLFVETWPKRLNIIKGYKVVRVLWLDYKYTLYIRTYLTTISLFVRASSYIIFICIHTYEWYTWLLPASVEINPWSPFMIYVYLLMISVNAMDVFFYLPVNTTYFSSLSYTYNLTCLRVSRNVICTSRMTLKKYHNTVYQSASMFTTYRVTLVTGDTLYMLTHLLLMNGYIHRYWNDTFLNFDRLSFPL